MEAKRSARRFLTRIKGFINGSIFKCQIHINMQSTTETLAIAKRPTKSPASSLGQPKKLLANFFSFKFNTASGDDRVHKYVLQVTPEVPNDSVIMRKLVRRSKYELREKLQILVVFRDCLYSMVNMPDLPEINIEFDGTTYKVKV